MESLKGILSIWGRFCFAHFVQRKGLRCICVAKLRRIYVAKMQRKSNENICVVFCLSEKLNSTCKSKFHTED